MNIDYIPFDEADKILDWHDLMDALVQGHRKPKAEIGDTFLYRGDDTVLSRAAWIDGLGCAVKTATVFPGNQSKGKPAIGGGVSLFSDEDGSLTTILDFHLVTKWKTAGDSLLGAKLLARPDSEKILIVGAGTVAETLRSSYGALFPNARFQIWNRTAETGQALAEKLPNTSYAPDLASAVAEADIIATATMSTEPVIRGEWLQPGQHLDLIGAYRPDMREVDDTALLRSKVFVDSFATTLGHIGELKIPLDQGVIDRDTVIAEYYDMDRFRREDADITVFKNGGGAHLDLMVSDYIKTTWAARGAVT